ncbi:hypothetical protein [Gemmatimonas sp.]
MREVRLSAREADMLRLIIACLFSPTTGRRVYETHANAVCRQREALGILDRALAREEPPAPASAPPT